MSGRCQFATIVAGFNLQTAGLEMMLLASALNSLFDYGSVFTSKLTRLLIRALVPLYELHLVCTLLLTMLLTMACPHDVSVAWR